MTRIRIDTEHVREVGRQLIAESDRMDGIGQELQSAIGGLDTGSWDGISRAWAEPMLDRVRPESARVADELDHLGRKLAHVAEVFEQEDNTAARNLAGMGWVDFGVEASVMTNATSSASPTKSEKRSDEKTFLEGIGDRGEYLGIGLDVAAALPALGLLSIKHMSGFSGNILRDAWSLGGKNLARTWRDMSSRSLGDLFKETDDLSGPAALVVGSVCEVIGETGENWREYEGDPGKMAGGLLFDSALGIGASVAGGAAGAFIGAALGGAVCSVIPVAGTSAGAVIGGKIGGIAGGWLGGKAAEWVEDVKIGDQELDQAVADTVDRGLDTIVDGVASLF